MNSKFIVLINKALVLSLKILFRSDDIVFIINASFEDREDLAACSSNQEVDLQLQDHFELWEQARMFDKHYSRQSFVIEPNQVAVYKSTRANIRSKDQ